MAFKKKKKCGNLQFVPKALYKDLPSGALIAPLGLCPKEVAGNGGSMMQEQVPQSAV